MTTMFTIVNPVKFHFIFTDVERIVKAYNLHEYFTNICIQHSFFKTLHYLETNSLTFYFLIWSLLFCGVSFL